MANPVSFVGEKTSRIINGLIYRAQTINKQCSAFKDRVFNRALGAACYNKLRPEGACGCSIFNRGLCRICIGSRLIAPRLNAEVLLLKQFS
jgi:hypothetical protein